MGKAVEGGNPAAPEISDEQGIAELAEIARCPDNSPGRVEPIAMLKAGDKFARWGVDVDEAETISAHGVVEGGVLLGIGHEKASADVLYVEWGKTGRDGRIIKRVETERHGIEMGIVDFHTGGAEIRHIEEAVTVDVCGCGALVDGPYRRAPI